MQTFCIRAGGASLLLRALLNNQGEQSFAPVLHGALHRSLHPSAAGKARQVNPKDVPKTVGLREGWNDVMAGATPPFDALCVTGLRGVAPATRALHVTVLWRRSYQRQAVSNAGSNTSGLEERCEVTRQSRNHPRNGSGSGSPFEVKKVRITPCTFRPANFFTRRAAYGIYSQRFASSAPAKVTAQNRPNGRERPHLFADDPPKSSVRSLPPS
jgi:hypothetical protein